MLLAYVQDLDPLRSPILSTLVAALPVATLFYLLVGRRWLAPWAGFAGSVIAILIAWLIYAMPLGMAGWSFVHGAVFGLLPIGWTVFGAMMLYNVTVETGQFAIIRRSVGSLSGDARVQAVLVGFAFGALMEGAAGAGSPVAICGAMLVGLGFPPFQAAVLCLIANTSPVAYGGLGVPILTLGSTSGIAPETLSVMAGHQLPLLSCLVPMYMVKCMGTWKQTFAVLPVLIVAGGSFAVAQFLFATMHYHIPGAPTVWPLTDVGGAIFSLVVTAIFLKFWKPRDEWHFTPLKAAPPPVDPVTQDSNIEIAKEEVEALMGHEPPGASEVPLTFFNVTWAWSPFAIMTVLLAVSGFMREAEASAKKPLDLGVASSYYEVPVPELHREVLRAERLRKVGATEDESREDAKFKIIWLTAPGTPVMIAALISMVMLRCTRAQVASIVRRTFIQMKVPIPTIALMLGLSYVTKYAGIDATLGVAFAATGVMYPFFAAMLGWLGVFLTGTDAGSNALFGSLQKITAGEIYTNHTAIFENSGLDRSQVEVLICTANSTGGVMGKMIDAQSICVATAGTHQIGKEADIFKAVVKHSVLLACVVGALVTLQAYVWPFTMMVPRP